MRFSTRLIFFALLLLSAPAFAQDEPSVYYQSCGENFADGDCYQRPGWQLGYSLHYLFGVHTDDGPLRGTTIGAAGRLHYNLGPAWRIGGRLQYLEGQDQVLDMDGDRRDDVDTANRKVLGLSGTVGYLSRNLLAGRGYELELGGGYMHSYNDAFASGGFAEVGLGMQWLGGSDFIIVKRGDERRSYGRRFQSSVTLRVQQGLTANRSYRAALVDLSFGWDTIAGLEVGQTLEHESRANYSLGADVNLLSLNVGDAVGASAFLNWGITGGLALSKDLDVRARVDRSYIKFLNNQRDDDVSQYNALLGLRVDSLPVVPWLNAEALVGYGLAFGTEPLVVGAGAIGDAGIGIAGDHCQTRYGFSVRYRQGLSSDNRDLSSVGLYFGIEHDSSLELGPSCRRGPTITVREYVEKPKRVTVRIVGPAEALAKLRAQVEKQLAAKGMIIVDIDVVAKPGTQPAVTIEPQR